MNYLKYFFSLTILFFSLNSFAQNKKDIKKNKVKSCEVSKTFTKDGKEITLKESFEKYDANGNIIENIQYEENGEIKSHESYIFNKDNDKTEEVHYDAEGKVKKKLVTKYNANEDKVEETEYDGGGALKEKNMYSYNANGNRIAEVTLDPNNNITKKITNIFDNKGMKTERRTYDGKNVLLSVKKYTYVY